MRAGGPSGRAPVEALAPSRGAARLGATPVGPDACEFLVWAPNAERVEVRLVHPQRRVEALEPRGRGYHGGLLEGVAPGALYAYGLDGGPDRPDPCSRWQPQGVHGPSGVVDRRHGWRHQSWRQPALADLVIYELHVGTFTAEGTFDAVIPHLEELRQLGITAIELMPIAQFPGERNWGYDGVQLFAAHDAYGGVGGLVRLVDAAHGHGLAVVLDVVYNHLGPEGNYLAEFGPYFTDRHRTPWGGALNFDGPGSDEVRRFFLENALYWTLECRVDALRLDAVHAIMDQSAYPFLEELAERVHREAERHGRTVRLIAETDANDPRTVRPPEVGGYGMDAHWADDFHHALHALLTGEREGYYADFGRVEDLARAFTAGYAYGGRRSAFRERRQGRPATAVPAARFVVCAQNHDQVGNRMAGDRLSALAPLEAQKVAAAAVLLSPFVPLLFMGEEYGETAPFPYFVSHGDEALVEAVRKGRREEFDGFRWQGEPPDPQAAGTFESARLDHALKERSPHREQLALYRELLALRPTLFDRGRPPAELVEAYADERDRLIVVVGREDVVTGVPDAAGTAPARPALVLHFGDSAASLDVPLPPGRWRRALDTAEERWAGPGSRVPERLESDGIARLELPGPAAVLFLRDDE